MKTLLLMRHAKSSWDSPGLPDHARPLNRRGQRDAPRMGQLLAEKEMLPDRILSSDAVRARQTAEAVAEALGFRGDIQLLEDLYGAGPDDYPRVLRAIPDRCASVLVISHNPGLEQFLRRATHRIEAMPTAAIAWLELALEKWSDLTLETSAELVQVWRPREE
jgi:phosphohistidine phosphatase